MTKGSILWIFIIVTLVAKWEVVKSKQTPSLRPQRRDKTDRLTEHVRMKSDNDKAVPFPLVIAVQALASTYVCLNVVVNEFAPSYGVERRVIPSSLFALDPAMVVAFSEWIGDLQTTEMPQDIVFTQNVTMGIRLKLKAQVRRKPTQVIAYW